MLPILYEDEHYVAIDKPCGLLVHRTRMAKDATVFALQLLRDQIGQHLYPVHRLDRPTSGILIFGKSSVAAHQLQLLFQSNQTQKTYLAIARGFTPPTQTIDLPLLKQNGRDLQEAVTKYQTLSQIQVPIPVSRYPTARYSLVKIQLLTGRWHQIRRHFAKIRHYLIGDKRHGDVKHNKIFANQLELPQLFLQATEFEFPHPFTKENVIIKAPLREDFKILFDKFEWKVKW